MRMTTLYPKGEEGRVRVVVRLLAGVIIFSSALFVGCAIAFLAAVP